jgi:hypothetical protein
MTRSKTGMSSGGMARMAGTAHAYCSVALQLGRRQAYRAKKEVDIVGGGWYGLVVAWEDSKETGARASPTSGCSCRAAVVVCTGVSTAQLRAVHGSNVTVRGGRPRQACHGMADPVLSVRVAAVNPTCHVSRKAVCVSTPKQASAVRGWMTWQPRAWHEVRTIHRLA